MPGRHVSYRFTLTTMVRPIKCWNRVMPCSTEQCASGSACREQRGKLDTLSEHAYCWQDAKAGALGRHRLTSKLAGPLAGEMLDTWTKRASFLAEKGWCARRRTNVT